LQDIAYLSPAILILFRPDPHVFLPNVISQVLVQVVT
jgi:hypothetical protein